MPNLFFWKQRVYPNHCLSDRAVFTASNEIPPWSTFAAGWAPLGGIVKNTFA